MDDDQKFAEEIMKHHMAAAAQMMAQQKALMERILQAPANPAALAQGLAAQEAILAQCHGENMQNLLAAQCAKALKAVEESLEGLEDEAEDGGHDEAPPGLALQDRFALGLSAIVFELNGDSHEWLHGDNPKEPWVKARCQEVLASWWDIESLKELKKTLQWLMEEGHSAEFEWHKSILLECVGMQTEAFKKIAALAKDELDAEDCEDVRRKLALASQAFMGEKSLRAWDYGRAVGIMRWAAGAGLLTDEEAWRSIRKLAVRVQKQFDSWKSFGENYVLGCSFWSGDKEQVAGCQRAAESLLDAANADSPWIAIPWDTPISLQP